MNANSAQPGSSLQGTARQSRTTEGLLKQRFGATRGESQSAQSSYDAQWAAAYKARNLSNSGRQSQESEYLPCVWNLPHG